MAGSSFEFWAVFTHVLFIQSNSEISRVSKRECPKSHVWFFISLPFSFYAFFVSPKNFLLPWKMFGCCLLSSALPLRCVSLCLLEEDDKVGRTLPLGVLKHNSRSFLLFLLSFESSVTPQFFSRSSIWGSGYRCRCSMLRRQRLSTSFHLFVLTEKVWVIGSEDAVPLSGLFNRRRVFAGLSFPDLLNSASKSGLFAAAAAHEEHLWNARSSARPQGRTIFGCWWNLTF